MIDFMNKAIIPIYGLLCFFMGTLMNYTGDNTETIEIIKTHCYKQTSKGIDTMLHRIKCPEGMK